MVQKMIIQNIFPVKKSRIPKQNNVYFGTKSQIDGDVFIKTNPETGLDIQKEQLIKSVI